MPTRASNRRSPQLLGRLRSDRLQNVPRRSDQDGPLVVYIISSSRSGSTALALSLGAYRNVFNAGELRNLMRSGVRDQGLCGCGEPLVECGFWGRVLGDDVHLASALNNPTVAIRDQDAASRARHFVHVLLGSKRHFARTDGKRHRALMASLYGAVGRASNCAAVIDSSKAPVGAAEIRSSERFDAFFIHLVRDPRAVAHSIHTPKVQVGDPKGRLMTGGSIAGAIAAWMTINTQAELLRLRAPKNFVRVRYEDLCANPEAALERIWSHMVASGVMASPPHPSLNVKVNHMAWGNPMRMNQSNVTWKFDARWKVQMTWRERTLSTFLSWPLAKLYGYHLRRGYAGDSAT